MRVVPLLLLFVCWLSVPVAPERLIATDLPAAIAADAADRAEYEALQAQADLALDLLKQAQERRLLAARVAAN